MNLIHWSKINTLSILTRHLLTHKKHLTFIMSAPDDKYLDELDKYNIEQDKYENHAHSGKGRSKKEATQHHHEDPSGHTRKDVQKLVNNAHKQAGKKAEKEKK